MQSDKTFPALNDLPGRAKKIVPLARRMVRQLKPGELSSFDQLAVEIHNNVFSHTDCLACGNCCRSLGPRLTNHDIDNLAGVFKMKPSTFCDSWLRIDEDGDFVFKSMPCPLIDDNNYCRVYENHPAACRDYPHTGTGKFHKRIELTITNAKSCPAVCDILEILTEQWNRKKRK
jgi:Fe-S-cluster containining protein